jgi:outer membrane protein
MRKSFHSLFMLCSLSFAYSYSLREVFEIAQANGMSWNARKLESEGQQLTGDIAMGALLPSVSVSASQSSGVAYYNAYYDEPYDNLVHHSSDSTPFSQTSMNLQFSIPIYAPVSIAAHHAAEIEEAISLSEYKIFQNNYIINLATRYFDVLKKDKSLDLVRTQVHMREKFFQDVQERYEVGLVAMTDLKESAAALDQAKSAEIQAAFALSSSQSALKILIASDFDTLRDLSWDTKIRLPSRFQEQGLHPSVVKALRAMEYSQALVTQSKASLLPSIQGFSSYSLQPLNQNIAHNVKSLSAGLSLSWSPPSGMGTLAQIQKYAYLFEASQAQYAQTLLNHQAQLDLYQQQFASALRHIEAQRATVISSFTYLDAVEASFEAGQRTTTDVLEAQQFLLQQQEELYSLLYDALLLHLNLGLENNYHIDDLLNDIDLMLKEEYKQH